LAGLCDGRATTAAHERVLYARDMWPKALMWTRAGYTAAPPDVVVWPSTLEQVVAVTRRAYHLGVPLVPFGAGSGVCGGTIPLKGGIALDLKRMARIKSVDLEAQEADVEAGIHGEIFERRLNRQGLSTGHFPSSMYCSTVGGWIAARGAGQASNRYGKIEDMVASVTVVDGRGEVLQTPRRPLPGWDATQLFIGSEGALGTIASARLHLVRAPEARVFSGFRFKSVEEGTEAIRNVFRAGVRPAVVRLYDPFDTLLVGSGHEGVPAGKKGLLRAAFDEKVMVRLQRLASLAAIGTPIGLNRAADLLRECLLVMVFEGPADLVELEAEEATRVCLAAGGEDKGPDPARTWLEKRYAVSYKQSKLFDSGAFVDTMEVAGTWDRVVEIYQRVREALAPLAFVMCHFSHAYPEGCALYFTFAGNARSLEELEQRYDAIWRAGLAAARSAGATASHHHGVGVSKLNALKGQLGDGLKLVRGLKATFDPKGILNPGKLGM
jgi:alkyldihydroxyacetonephosphate synthase